ncbi:GM23026 [Drosophila sechellia]|uniref:GM23026 n=1 Tax=Drosophila sechellia TaxID=7238 RepID=B4I671_DROSE|nr:GM23026 [Drosophila sechellia]
MFNRQATGGAGSSGQGAGSSQPASAAPVSAGVGVGGGGGASGAAAGAGSAAGSGSGSGSGSAAPPSHSPDLYLRPLPFLDAKWLRADLIASLRNAADGAVLWDPSDSGTASWSRRPPLRS